MECMNCKSTNDVIDFISGDEKLTLCVKCRTKLVTGRLVSKKGRNGIGITKKVSLTLTDDKWQWFDEKANGNRSAFLRNIVDDKYWSEGEWSNYAALGYTIKALQELNYTDEQIQNVISELKYTFDMKTIDEAKDIYTNSPY